MESKYTTIHIVKRGVKENTKLIKDLYKELLYSDNSFHYFYEPDLIIRTTQAQKLESLLEDKGVLYVKYDYPYTVRGFGEDKKYQDIQSILTRIYHLQSVLALTITNKKKLKYITNRMHHCFLNMRGFEYYDEAEYLIDQARRYFTLERENAQK